MDTKEKHILAILIGLLELTEPKEKGSSEWRRWEFFAIQAADMRLELNKQQQPQEEPRLAKFDPEHYPEDKPIDEGPIDAGFDQITMSFGDIYSDARNGMQAAGELDLEKVRAFHAAIDVGLQDISNQLKRLDGIQQEKTQ